VAACLHNVHVFHALIGTLGYDLAPSPKTCILRASIIRGYIDELYPKMKKREEEAYYRFISSLCTKTKKIYKINKWIIYEITTI
jgi:hypothetical protein